MKIANLWLVKSGSMIGGSTFGSPQNANNAITDERAANKIVSSNITGTNAGPEKNGLPPTLIGQSTADVQYVRAKPLKSHVVPMMSVTHGIFER